MFHQPSCDTPHLYRALVTFADEHTGEIRVKIPSLTGIESEASLSYIGRSSRNGFWVVPEVNSQILVTADDPNFSNIFWVRSDEVKNRSYLLTAYDTTTQTNTVNGSGVGIARVITFNSVSLQEGITLVDNSKATFAHTGTYNIQFSIQFENTSTSREYDAVVWLNKNGNDIPYTSSYVTVHSKKNNINGKALMSLNIIENFVYDDYVQLWWTAQSASVTISTINSESLIPSVPVSPGVIVTVTQVA